MAAVVLAELRLRDGQRQTLRVQTETQTQTNQNPELGALISAVRELSHSVTCLLTELVQREQGHGACAADEDGNESEDEEDSNESEPEPKRTKTWTGPGLKPGLDPD